VDDERLLDDLGSVEQGLVIVNSRAHALDLFQAAKQRGLAGVTHLTTRQCAAHRREILARVRQHLPHKTPCRVIATSLVEAGVDIDFPRVWRARAGLDQIAQAAGRCNREGKRPVESSIVTLFDAADHNPPHELHALAEDMRRVAGKHADIFSPAAIKDYFGEVYWRKGEERLDKFGALKAFGMSDGKIDFSYRTLGENFKLIESGMEPVIVPYDAKAKETLEKLKTGFLPPGAAARALQTYVVQVPPRARLLLLANGHVRFADPPGQGGNKAQQFAELVTDSLYSPEFGLFWERADYLGLESFLI
jgi:CRISPR-associated endonuclease/helicase Cas3